MRQSAPRPPHPQRDLIPKELRARPQWFCWKYKLRDKDQFSKVPINPRTGREGKPNDPTTCGTFDQAWTLYNNNDADINGVGFLFTPDEDFAGVDLDDCRDLETGTLEPWAAAVVHSLNSYSEVSPSGTGVKVFLRATKRGIRERKGQVEMYDRNHYFTVTGHHVPGTPGSVEERQEAFNLLYDKTFSRDAENTPQPSMREPAPITNLEDHTLIKRAAAAKNGTLFTTLLEGDTSAYGDDESAADLAFLRLLAFWSGKNAEQMERIWRSSGLNRPKLDRDDYRNRTITRAICDQGPTYAPNVPTRTAAAATLEAYDDKDTELARLRDENAKQKSRMGDMLEIIHDSRLKDRDRLTALICWNLTGTYPSDPDLATREGGLVRLADVGAAFGSKMVYGKMVNDKMVNENLRKKGSVALKQAVELGLVAVEKHRNDLGHDDMYLKARALPDKALTMEELKTTHRQNDVARHAAPRCKRCKSHRLLATTWECENCGELSTQAEALAAGLDYDLDQHAPTQSRIPRP